MNKWRILKFTAIKTNIELCIICCSITHWYWHPVSKLCRGLEPFWSLKDKQRSTVVSSHYKIKSDGWWANNSDTVVVNLFECEQGWDCSVYYANQVIQEKRKSRLCAILGTLPFAPSIKPNQNCSRQDRRGLAWRGMTPITNSLMGRLHEDPVLQKLVS